MSFWQALFSNSNDRLIRSLQPLVDQANSFEESMEAKSDDELRECTKQFRGRLNLSESLDDLLAEAFAAVREASRRTSGKRHFDVQFMGGIALHRGMITQMATGEGKTLVATLPVYLNALTGDGVHVVTVNDYLSRRDAVWMGEVYEALGMSVGVLNHDTSYRYDPTHIAKENTEALDAERDQTGAFRVVHEFLRPITRQEAYATDITYGTNNEFGFDYLRDNMVSDKSQMVQRGHNYAIVDEVDSILIDEARTPLIISAPDEESGELYRTFSRVVPHLVEEDDFTVDEKLRTVSITDNGIEKVQKQLGIEDLYQEGGTRYVHHLEQALRAQSLFQRDKDYVVTPASPAGGNGEVIIVDEFTGRLMPGRRWSDGLHQAVEAKEGVAVQRESRTLATVTFQNYFRLYKKLSGMTGTARTSAEEFHAVYGRDVAIIPTHRPMIRKDLQDRIYKSEQGKFRALIAEIKKCHESEQPVLVGTVSIEKNELLSHMLARAGVTHQVLNAKNHEREAEIIAQAGKPSAVTVATNMAGRGVDIILGGNPSNESDAERVLKAGGLAVFGTERHEARRIDDQLRGRSGRQGDPGTSQFFVSCEDELMRVFGGDRIKSLMERLGVTDDDVIENRLVSRSIAQAQERVEGHNFDSRKQVLEYDDVMNRHRQTIYRLRSEILSSENNRDLVINAFDVTIQGVVAGHINENTGEIDTKEIADALRGIAPFAETLGESISQYASGNKESLIEYLKTEIRKLYEKHEESIGAEQMRAIERAIILRIIDDVWVEHLETMESLRDSVRLRAYGQRDPLVEYKLEAQRLYSTLLSVVWNRVASVIFRIQVGPPLSNQAGLRRGEPTAVSEKSELGRNDPCWCGSGKKYKRCHGA